jgi:hypothetical protein
VANIHKNSTKLKREINKNYKKQVILSSYRGEILITNFKYESKGENKKHSCVAS